eukprot:Awhi_evm1s3847
MIFSNFIYFLFSLTSLTYAIPLKQTSRRSLDESRTHISWAGHEWNVKTCNGCAPANNKFSIENVILNDDDTLTLKVEQRNGQWYNAEIWSFSPLGYGNASITIVDSSSDFLDINTIMAFYTYDTERPSTDYSELDIELSHFGFPDRKSSHQYGQYVIQPYLDPTNMYNFNMPQGLSGTNLSMYWTNIDNNPTVEFQSMILDSDNTPTSIKWKKDIYTSTDELTHISLWSFNGKPPSSQETQWVKIKFNFEPFSTTTTTNTQTQTATVTKTSTTSATSTSTPTSNPSNNLVLNKPTKASSTLPNSKNAYEASNAVDGNQDTSWVSNNADDSAWISVDLE